MKARLLSAAATTLFLLAAACGSDPEADAGASIEPGPTGMIESTTADVPEGSAPDGLNTGPGAAGTGGTVVEGPAEATVSTAPNAPPAMATPATEGDTTVRVVP